ncbi:hypothetical protein B0T25DRAFT_207900 [Lasiosphaeria hispida]|uniref:G domain-containing protein n=1 Tax=Lasiosphaeria hispida TaxID=260671 RepID=A0AAJ0MEA9_9PEZI|nr:hypothetical protein B0T25DRAFT_207900 [Lasiosphaeria hispida]
MSVAAPRTMEMAAERITDGLSKDPSTTDNGYGEEIAARAITPLICADDSDSDGDISDDSTDLTSEDGSDTSIDDFSEDEEDDDVTLTPDDTVVAVMGVTGVGKSNFISHFNGKAKVGRKLKSKTSKIGVFEASIDGHGIYLVDTPGFDDTNLSDIEVLRKLALWLTDTDKRNVHLAGIVYLHRISDLRMNGSAMKNLRMFRKLCGPEALSHVVLATTMWDTVSKRSGEKRLKELRTNPDYWAGMIKEGSKIFRQDNGLDSATTIIRHIHSLCSTPGAKGSGNVRLKIQTEMAGGSLLNQTAAGMVIEEEMKKLQDKHTKEMQTLQDEWRQAASKSDTAAQEEIARVRVELERQISQGEEDRKRMQVNFDELKKERIREIEEGRERAREEQRRAREEFDGRLKKGQERIDRMQADFDDQIRRHDEGWQRDRERLYNEIEMEREMHGKIRASLLKQQLEQEIKFDEERTRQRKELEGLEAKVIQEQGNQRKIHDSLVKQQEEHNMKAKKELEKARGQLEQLEAKWKKQQEDGEKQGKNMEGLHTQMKAEREAYNQTRTELEKKREEQEIRAKEERERLWQEIQGLEAKMTQEKESQRKMRDSLAKEQEEQRLRTHEELENARKESEQLAAKWKESEAAISTQQDYIRVIEGVLVAEKEAAEKKLAEVKAETDKQADEAREAMDTILVKLEQLISKDEAREVAENLKRKEREKQEVEMSLMKEKERQRLEKEMLLIKENIENLRKRGGLKWRNIFRRGAGDGQ